MQTQRIQQFFAEIRTMLPYIQEAQREIDRATAGQLNLFSLYLARNEMALSAILRDLLDPRGPHGQGELFLRLFVEMIGFDAFPVHEQVTAICEAPLSNQRRLDLLLRSTDGYFLGIENKPWAGEQHDQLADYNLYLRQQSGDPARYRLIYLAGHEMNPASIDAAIWEQIGINCPYHRADSGPSLRAWLTRCIEQAQPDKLRWFLHDFADYIVQHFPALESPPRKEKKDD